MLFQVLILDGDSRPKQGNIQGAETFDSEGRFMTGAGDMNASYGLPTAASINGNYVA